jgi:hypothetical protein
MTPKSAPKPKQGKKAPQKLRIKISYPPPRADDRERFVKLVRMLLKLGSS